MIKDKVINIKEDGEYNGRPKWKVKLQDSGEYTFFTQFDAKVGDQINFTIGNPKYKTAKLVGVVGNEPMKSKYDTAQSILRQVAFKGAIELVANGNINVSEIEQYTNDFHIILNK
jgi:predicted peptidase